MSQCDNMAALVSVLSKRSCRDKNLMHLMGCLHFFFFFQAQYHFYLVSELIRGVDNDSAADLSHNPLTSFVQGAQVIIGKNDDDLCPVAAFRQV